MQFTSYHFFNVHPTDQYENEFSCLFIFVFTVYIFGKVITQNFSVANANERISNTYDVRHNYIMIKMKRLKCESRLLAEKYLVFELLD